MCGDHEAREAQGGLRMKRKHTRSQNSQCIKQCTFTIMPQFLPEIKLSVFDISLHFNKLKGLKACIEDTSSIFNQFQRIACISDRALLSLWGVK